MNCLTEEINWSCLVSPESSQVVGRAVYPILYQLGHTCGGWEFCNSFHLTSIVSDMIHELGLQGKIQKLYIIYSALRVSKKISSFCSWRAEEREQKSVTNCSWIYKRCEVEKELCYCGWGVHRSVIHSITGPIWYAKREDDERNS